MDAGKYYALLRFEEAAVALRAAFQLRVVEQIGDRKLTSAEFRDLFGFTEQGTRTFVPLLEVMEVLRRRGKTIEVAGRAADCLSSTSPHSRLPYLTMGPTDESDQLIRLLRGELPEDSIPLYGPEDAQTLMDTEGSAANIAYGLASRARNFAAPLAAAIKPHAGKAKIMVDIGAGSPFVASSCLAAIPHLSQVKLVDRANAMQFARKMAEDVEIDLARVDFVEHDFFQSVPAADIYCLSNTAHDWLAEEYSRLMQNVRDAIAPGGIVCLHEPILAMDWNSAEQWVHALWMACYALTLFRLTAGKGTCYTRFEHNEIMARNGFQPLGEPVNTTDGCTALIYQLAHDATALPPTAETALSMQR